AIISAAFTLTYVSTTRILEQQTADVVQAEIEGLRESYRDGGADGLIDTIGVRAHDDSAAVYLLANKAGEAIIGNLSKWPAGAPIDGRWMRVRLTRAATGQEIEIGARAFDVDDLRLLVGRDLAAQRSFQEALIEAGAVALLIAVLLAAGAGFLLNRLVMRRIGDIDHTARAIVAGDLTTRIPVRSMSDEFGRLAFTLNQMLERIEVLVVELRTVTDSLSHDLRTPLTRLKTQIQRAADSDLEAPTRREALGAAADEADRILSSFSAMIDIARAEAGAAKDQFTELDLTPMMEDIFELHQPLAEEFGVKLSFSGAEPVKVRGHAQFLAQLVSNLVDNAMKHGALKRAGSDKAISMSVHAAKGFAEIEVADNGPGIPEDQRSFAIKRFGRLDAARTTPGSGLGLSLAATLARMHGGELLLEDNNPGLKVRVRLPLAS
ncbi:MAG TPA: HAMP domain-containing sensor histidine kinase, partial [Hyphomonadaceae bacterium]|nr:HAMP domain-containing sensor histidine kinase [Hyphomonadaceae bacterium]